MKATAHDSRAWNHPVKDSKTFRPCWRHVAAALSTRSTNRLPHPLAVPPLDLRPNDGMAQRPAARLFVG